MIQMWWIEAFIRLIESGVALYTWQSSRFVSLISYTCKVFDDAKARAIVADFFQLSKMESKVF